MGEPLVERLDLGVALAGDVDDPFPVHLVDPAGELGPFRPGDDLDSFGWLDPEQRRQEIQLHLELAPDFGEAATLGEGEARLVAELDMGEEGIAAVRGGPARELDEQRRAESPAAARRGHDRAHDGLRAPRVLHGQAGGDGLAALEREQVHLLGRRHPRAEILDRDRMVGENGVAELEPPLELGVVARGADLGHTATIRPKTYGGDLVSTWSVLRQSCKPRSPVGLVNPPGNQVSADNELALAA